MPSGGHLVGNIASQPGKGDYLGVVYMEQEPVLFIPPLCGTRSSHGGQRSLSKLALFHKAFCSDGSALQGLLNVLATAASIEM